MRLGPYELLERIGAGGMGEVWRARDTHLHRDVAIKILPAELASDREWKQRFLREARTAARLNHPGIVTVYSVADTEDTMYIAMELVEGQNLGEIIGMRRMPAEEVCRVGIDAATALHEAHRAGIIHRDVKPENLILTRRGVKVLDFGLAKDHGNTDFQTTAVHTIVGTPMYMSPEQALGRKLDARSDVFSLGAVLYEALSGEAAFVGDTVQGTLLNVISAVHRPLERVPRALSEVIDRCLQKMPESRYPTAFDLAEALSAIGFADQAVHEPTVALRLGPKGRALVVDDDELVRVILQAALADVGFEVDEAENGADAIRQLKRREYDAMFLDLLMPRVDGWTVLDFLRRTGERRPRNVYVTSGVRDLRLSDVDASVVTDVLKKPLHPRQMMDIAAQI